jgi:hypothetical protein
VASHIDEPTIPSLAPFHGFSPILKSLRITVPFLPSSHIFNLIFSFPFLEDLAVSACLFETSPDNGDGPEEDEMPAATQPLTSPMFTGSLELYLKGGMEPFIHRLLSRPGGIHFQNLALTWLHKEDSLATTVLVERCSHTLESIDISGSLHGMSIRHPCPPRYLLTLLVQLRAVPIDLSKTIKLKDLVFRLDSWTVGWMATTLRTITSNHRDFRLLKIRIPYCPAFLTDDANTRQHVGEANYIQWLDIDRLLIRLWESRAVRPQVICTTANCLGYLLPEVTKSGIVDFVRR